MNPVSPAAVIGGKWMAAAVFSVVGSMGSLWLSAYAVDAIPLQDLGYVSDWKRGSWRFAWVFCCRRHYWPRHCRCWSVRFRRR